MTFSFSVVQVLQVVFGRSAGTRRQRRSSTSNVGMHCQQCDDVKAFSTPCVAYWQTQACKYSESVCVVTSIHGF